MSEPKRPLKVFLSYASQDKPHVRELSRRLVGEGWIDTWQDEKNLLPGQDWRVKIEEAVEEADIVVICLSNHSVSKEGHVQKELRYAREIALEKPEDSIFLIPLRLDECEVPRGLRFYQWVDYFGDMKDPSYRALVASLHLRYEQKRMAEDVEKAAREKAEREAIEKGHQLRAGKEAKHVPVKSKAGGQIAYWIGGFTVLILGIALLSSLNNPSSISQPTPENTQTQTIAALPQNTVEPSATTTPESTSTPSVTLTPTPLPTEIMDAKGVPMALVSQGNFSMGSADSFASEKPVLLVYLSSYYIDKYEVTNRNYNLCVQAGDCLPPKKRGSKTQTSYFGNPVFDNYPVIYVTWDMAQKYCQWRDARLPSEAEWEKAARGAAGRIYPWGDTMKNTEANYNGLVGDLTVVGKYNAGTSPYGLFDMAGNAQEWVNDWYQANYYASLFGDVQNPQGPLTGDERVIRGGSWDAGKNFIRTTYRFKSSPSVSFYNIGFRCAKDATQ